MKTRTPIPVITAARKKSSTHWVELSESADCRTRLRAYAEIILQLRLLHRLQMAKALQVLVPALVVQALLLEPRCLPELEPGLDPASVSEPVIQYRN